MRILSLPRRVDYIEVLWFLIWIYLSNSTEGISNHEKIKKKLTTATTNKKYKKHNKNENEESKIVKKLISKEVKQRGEEEGILSFYFLI